MVFFLLVICYIFCCCKVEWLIKYLQLAKRLLHKKIISLTMPFFLLFKSICLITSIHCSHLSEWKVCVLCWNNAMCWEYARKKRKNNYIIANDLNCCLCIHMISSRDAIKFFLTIEIHLLINWNFLRNS